MKPTCPGDCCERFYLPFSYRDLQRFAEPCEEGHDTKLVAAMALPLGLPDGFEPGPNGTPAHVWPYTCRFWDPETRLCTIYEQRPAMCRGFPYRAPCGYCGRSPEAA